MSYIQTKYVLGELCLEDLLPIFNKKTTAIVVITNHTKNLYTSWEAKTTFLTTNSDGETVEEQDDYGDFILYTDEKEGPSFKLKQKVRIQENKIFLTDNNYNQTIIQLYQNLDLSKMLLSSN